MDGIWSQSSQTIIYLSYHTSSNFYSIVLRTPATSISVYQQWSPIGLDNFTDVRKMLPCQENIREVPGGPLSPHNQLRIILMDITLYGLLCIRIILGWLCRLSPLLNRDFYCVILFNIFLINVFPELSQLLPNLDRYCSSISTPALWCYISISYIHGQM